MRAISLISLGLLGCLEAPGVVECYAGDGCGGQRICVEGRCVERPVDGQVSDTGADALVDARAVDAAVDGQAPDSTKSDVGSDAGRDAARPPMDAVVDAVVDAALDAALDAASDAEPDADPDRGPTDPDATPPEVAVAGYQASPRVDLLRGAGDQQVFAAWADSAWVLAWADEVDGRRRMRVACVPPDPQQPPPVFDLDEGLLLMGTSALPSIAVAADGFRVARAVPIEGQNRIRIAHFALPVAGACAAPLSDDVVMIEDDVREIFLIPAGAHQVLLWHTRGAEPAAKVAWLDENPLQIHDLAAQDFASRTAAWHPGTGRLGYAWDAFGSVERGQDLFFRTLGADGQAGFERVAAASPLNEKAPWVIADGAGFGLVARAEGAQVPERILEYHTLQPDGRPLDRRLIGWMLPHIAVTHGPPAFDGRGTLGVAWQGLGNGVQPSLDLSLRPAGDGVFHRLRLDAGLPSSVAVAGGPNGFAVVFADGLSLVLIEVR